MTTQARVAVLMGSDSDWEVMQGAVARLKAFGIGCEVHVMSAHRTPARVSEYVSGGAARGIGVFIAAAGAAAHLAGVVAAHTTRPVIGVPLNATALNGLDALLATVQMPSGVPVATVAVGGAENAGILAAQILAVGDPALAAKLDEFKRDMAAKVVDKDAKLQAKL
ncbi:MAG: 5-(carboxyamino)imidazole ribonucleotide mutase [Deltaproteobacteria bacterium]|nr:5-(carboxyamino)imidazole ribonucleotide mutase [Deltaproteobacteria bacterium]